MLTAGGEEPSSLSTCEEFDLVPGLMLLSDASALSAKLVVTVDGPSAQTESLLGMPVLADHILRHIVLSEFPASEMMK